MLCLESLLLACISQTLCGLHALPKPCQDAYWTTGRSTLVSNGARLHPAHKHVAIDGRVRAVPAEDGRSFAPFWSVTRTEASWVAPVALVSTIMKVKLLIDITRGLMLPIIARSDNCASCRHNHREPRFKRGRLERVPPMHDCSFSCHLLC
jgi:hypothetical protein